MYPTCVCVFLLFGLFLAVPNIFFFSLPFSFIVSFRFSASLRISLLGNIPLLFFFSVLYCHNFACFLPDVSSFYYVMVVPAKQTADDAASSSIVVPIGRCRKSRRLVGLSVLPHYLDCGDCSWVCEFCGVFFWYVERALMDRCLISE